MQVEYNINLPIKPTPKGRPRFSKFGHAYTPQKTLDAETQIKYMLMSWKNRNNFSTIEDKPIAIEFTFGMAMPKSYSKKKRDELLGKPHIIKPDCDNLIKLQMDAMNGIIFKDDSLVYSLKGTKLHTEEDFVDIKIFLENA